MTEPPITHRSVLYPEPPAEFSRPRPRNLLRWMGPGVIIASVTIGSGELVWASRSGAIFGFSMLWCFLFAGVFKAIQVYTAARHMTLTGEHPLVGWSVPRRFPILPLLIAFPAVGLMPVAFSAIPEMLGSFIDRLTEGALPPPATSIWAADEYRINVWTTVVMVVCLTFALVSNYQLLERVSAVVLGAIVMCVAVAVVRLGPDVVQLLKNLLVPRVDEFPLWLTTNPEYADEFRGRSPWLEVSLYLTAVGGGAYDYIGYLGMLREKQWGLAGSQPATRPELAAAVDSANSTSAETLRRARVWVRAPFVDAVISFFFVILVTLLFAILGALVLHPAQSVPANTQLLMHQELFLVALHPELKWLYRGGVFLAFLGTLYGAYEVYQHTFAESVRAIVPRWSTVAAVRVCRRLTVAWCFFGGMTMIWLPASLAGSVVQRMTFGSIVSGAAACGVWCFAMLVLDHFRLPPALRMSPLLKTLTAVAGIVMSGLGVITTVAYFSNS